MDQSTTPGAVVQRAMTAFNADDLDTLRAQFAPNVAWHAPGDGPFGGDFSGVDAVVDWLSRMREFDLNVTPVSVLSGRDHVFAFMRIHGSSGPEKFDVLDVGAYRIEDGRIVEHWWLVDDQTAFDRRVVSAA